MKFLNPIEHAIYAAMFTTRLGNELAAGVHQAFRDAAARDGKPPEDAVGEWERWCADVAIEAAESAVEMHRAAMRRRKA